MMVAQILQPVIVLILWSLLMLGWLMVVRVPALRRAGLDLRSARGGNSGALDRLLEEQAQWPAHNYIHLMEQPTLFYALALLLALLGEGGGLNAGLAWAYVGVRIAHSLVQATANRVLFRLPLFMLSTVLLAALAIRAAILVF